MDKKEYEAPKMEVVEMPFGGRLLDGSPILVIEGEGEGDDAY